MDVHPPKNGIFIGIDPYPSWFLLYWKSQEFGGFHRQVKCHCFFVSAFGRGAKTSTGAGHRHWGVMGVMYPLVMTNIAMVKPWPIEIDGLPIAW